MEGDKSESPILTSESLFASVVTMCCNVFTVKQPSRTLLCFRKKKTFSLSGVTLERSLEEMESVFVRVSVSVWVLKSLFGMKFHYDRS